MKLSLELSLACLAFSNVEAFAVPPRSLWAGSLADRSYRAHPVRSDASFHPVSVLAHGGVQRRTAQQQQKGNNGGLKIGGLTIGGPNGGISGNGLQLGGNRQKGQQQQQGQQQQGEQQQGQQQGEQQQGQQQQGEQQQTEQANRNSTAPATEQAQAPKKQPAAAGCQALPPAETPSTTPSTSNQPNRAEGEAAAQEAQREGQEAQQEAASAQKTNGVKATEESERFSNEAGITLDQAGNAQNLGGNLGITKGSDGSTSVGGENGINIGKSG